MTARAALPLLLLALAACAGNPAPPAGGVPPVESPDVRAGGRPRAVPGQADPADSLFGGVVSERDVQRIQVVETVRAELGKPYRLGGRGDAGAFDCSGLIQMAYERQGVPLPRVSRDQARAGVEVEKDPARLLPGDLLTFARKPGGRTVTHVGMYVGNGRFIHSSSSRGVVESALAESDPEGRWWWRRWVGVRRILTD